MPSCDVLVNNAGGALGLGPVDDADEEQWRWMYEANVLGTVRMTHAQRAAVRTLRLELLGRPVRITEVAPGMVETEFSLVRFGGDEEAAAQVYEGMEPLRAEDVAECIRWAVERPPRVTTSTR